jgi:putative spermidine/putrescine transport system ATP-binding protein
MIVDVLAHAVRVPQSGEALAPGSAVTLVVRPEAVQVSPQDGTEDHWQGVVQRATYLGSAVDYEINVAGQTILAQDSNPLRGAIIPEGDPAAVRFLEDCVHVLKKD